MDFLAEKIIARRGWIIALFVLALAVFGVGALTTRINYNMTDYLPPDANSTQAIEVMRDSFGEELANTTVMVPVDGVVEAQEYKDRIAAVDGVTEVLWLDDVLDVKVPLASQDQDTVETYYKDGMALYTVTISGGKEVDAVNALYDLVGNEGAVTGNAVDQANSQNMALSQCLNAIMVLGPLIILILVLATRSWIEPFLYLLCIGVAVVVNLGISGITGGEISYVTLSVSPILQLAVALDYAVFLSTAYTAAREKTDDCKLAMKEAMKGSAKPIFASALVGVFAFAALTFMDFQIGPDMGWSLVRGVVISYVVVITLLPALIVSLDRLVQKTRHRSFFPSFKRLGGVLVKVRIPALLVIAALAVPCFLGQAANSFVYGSGESSSESRVAQDEQKIEAIFGSENTLALLVPRGDAVAEANLCDDIEAMDGVKSVTAYATAVGNQIPAEYLGDAAEGYYGTGTTYLCGQSANLYDMMQTVRADNERVDLITVVAIFVVLMLVFRSLIIPLLSVVTIKVAVFINMAIPYFMGDELSFIGYMIVSVVMMGSAIDYGILLIDHYLVERRSMPKLAAMRAALPKAIPAMLVSALILAIAGFALAFVSSEAMVQALGMLLGRGAVIAFVLSITLLPALLLVFDRLLPLLSVKLGFYKGTQEEYEQGLAIASLDEDVRTAE